MRTIQNKGRIFLFKALLTIYVLFFLFVFVYKYLWMPDTSKIWLWAAVLPILAFLATLSNWPVHFHALSTDDGVLIQTRKLFFKKEKSLVINKANFDGFYDTGHRFLGLKVLDEKDQLRKHKIKVSWISLKDLRALEQKLNEINPYAKRKDLEG